jgi:pimeloyl-ACP methyl ester carboxylesterase
MPIWERDDLKLHYEEFGTGFPLLLFAPGGMNSTIDFWSRMPWNPIDVLSEHFRVIAMDQRNAGGSTAPISGADGWKTYASDHIALLEGLGIARCHVLGCCIGGSYSLGLIEADPDRVAGAVLVQPIGHIEANRKAFYAMFDSWADGLRAHRPETSEADWAAFRSRMYDGDFVFNVSRDFVRSVQHPLLVLMGDDLYHPETISREVAELAPRGELVESWKEGPAVQASAARVVEFLQAQTP